MKRSAIKLTLVTLIIICLVSIAYFGISAINLPGVFDDDGIVLGLDLAGGSTIVYRATAEGGGRPSADEMNAVKAMLQARLDMLQYTEATVQISDGELFRLEIPGISNPEEAVQMLGASAVLEFRDADGEVILTGKDVKKSMPQYGDPTGTGMSPQHFISLEFSDEGAGIFYEATAAAANRKSEGKNYISIYLDGKELMSPSVEKAIDGGSCIITGGYSRETAEYYAHIITSGSLPLILKDIQLSSVGPVLGETALSSSLVAGAIGLILVMIFMIVFYRLPGAVAAFALIAYVAIVGIVFVITRTNLSLPGIAGIILSVGMAVDANIIIFERVKEELYNGRTLRMAVTSGFKRAFTAIFDSNITTLMVAAVLYYFGTGPIKGFASTLFIGVLVSMLTAIVITRALLTCIIDMNIRDKRFYGLKASDMPAETPEIADGKKPASGQKTGFRTVFNFKYTSRKPMLIVISSVIILAGLASFFIRGFNWDIDFVGGTVLNYKLHATLDVAETQKIQGLIEDAIGRKVSSVQASGRAMDEVIIKLINESGEEGVIDSETRAVITEVLDKNYGIDPELA